MGSLCQLKINVSQSAMRYQLNWSTDCRQDDYLLSKPLFAQRIDAVITLLNRLRNFSYKELANMMRNGSIIHSEIM